jgi:hypothetical protein
VRNAWTLLALLSLLQVLPSTSAVGTVALVVCFTALALAFADRAVAPRAVLVRARAAVAVAPPIALRQYAPARAGRPQPRAPGCGR